MRSRRKRLIRGIAALALIAVAVGIVVVGNWWFSDKTYCAGVFETSVEAERAAEDAREAGFGGLFGGVEVREDRRRTLVTVTIQDTGEDAEEARSDFARIRARHGGAKVHPPDDGCWERGIGD